MHQLDTFVKRSSLLIRVSALALALVGTVSLFDQKASAKNTYVITDGDQVTVHTTYATDPTVVLGELGITVEETDIVETTPTDDGHEINVIRGMEIAIDNCGQKLTALSYGETVGQLLERNGIVPGRSCAVSVDLDAQVTDGMAVVITDTIISKDSYTLTIPFETVYQQTDLLKEGQEVVLTEGVNGQLLCKSKITYVNGQEAGRVLLSERVTTEPVTKVIAVGTGNGTGNKNAKPIIGDGVIITPEGDVLTYSSIGTFKATAYTHTDPGCGFYTATGTRVHVGSVAVDPTVIPYGTRMFIVTKDGRYIYGVSTAEDCGGSIKNDRIDLYFPTYDECIQFGVRNCYVYFLG